MLVFRRIVPEPHVRQGSNFFCPSRKKHTAGALGGVPMELPTSDFFCLSSTRPRKVVQNTQATQRQREVVKPNTAGGSGVAIEKWSRTPTLSQLIHMIISCDDQRLVGSTRQRKVVQNPHSIFSRSGWWPCGSVG